MKKLLKIILLLVIFIATLPSFLIFNEKNVNKVNADNDIPNNYTRVYFDAYNISWFGDANASCYLWDGQNNIEGKIIGNLQIINGNNRTNLDRDIFYFDIPSSNLANKLYFKRTENKNANNVYNQWEATLTQENNFCQPLVDSTNCSLFKIDRITLVKADNSKWFEYTVIWNLANQSTDYIYIPPIASENHNWYLSEDKVEIFTSSNISNDITLYELEKPKITFYDGSSINSIAYVEIGEAFPKITPPIKNGYSFLGYYTEKDGLGEQYYQDDGSPLYQICNFTSTLDLYADYDLVNYSITYNLNGGTISTSEDLKTTYNIETETFTLPQPTKEGEKFIGWTSDVQSTPTLEMKIEKGSYGNLTFNANWEQSVTFYVDMSLILKDIPNAKDPCIHYWGSTSSSGNMGMDNIKEKMIQDEKNASLYYLEIPINNMSDITHIIFYFYENNVIKQTEDIELSEVIDSSKNKEKYSINTPTPLEWNNGKITNIYVGECYIVSYYDNDKFLEEEMVLPNIDFYPMFIEKENYKLEGWYTSIDLNERLEAGSPINGNLTLYANYVEGKDYDIYVDASNITSWKPHAVYQWSSYFNTHENSPYPGSSENIEPIGNNIFKITIDISKSFDYLIVDNNNLNDNQQSQDIILTPLHTYYILGEDKVINPGGTIVNNIYYEKNLNNFMEAQKVSNPSVNSFRFICGLSKEFTDISSDIKNFGFKFIFINNENDYYESYVGYWNFNSNSMLDAVRIGDNVYQKDHDYSVVPYEGNSNETINYQGFYALTLSDGITFKYQDYSQIIVIACYKDQNNNLQVIKANEYKINVEGSNVTLTTSPRV